MILRPGPPPGGAGISRFRGPSPSPEPPPPLSFWATETPATPNAVIAAASRDSPSGPNLTVMPLFFFFTADSFRLLPVAPGLPTMKPAEAERSPRPA